MSVKTYDPSQVTLMVGISIIAGWDKIVVRADEDKWTFKTGTNGETTRTKNASKVGEIEITIPQAHLDNFILSGLELTGALVACTVTDWSGNSAHGMPEGSILKMPESEYGKESTDRVWTIKGNVTPSVVGGNF